MPSLVQPNLKMGRAKEHFDSLYVEVCKYRDSYPHHFSTAEDVERNEWVVRSWVDFPDVTIALIAGDFIACLRSALDYVAWQLAMLTTDAPSKEICFPICDKDSLDTQLKITRATFQIPDLAVSIMKSFQPYQHGDAYQASHLWRLHKLWNIDKHRHLTPYSMFAEIPVPDGVPIPKFERFGDKNEVRMRFPLSAKDQVYLDPRLPVEVNFGDEKQGISLTVDELFSIYQFVRDEVIPRFASFFPQ